jgi:hypothetical protein
VIVLLELLVTVIFVVLVLVQPLPSVSVYVIVCVPRPAVAGLNVPADALVMPVPDQVPPPVAAVRLVAGSVGQNGPAGVIVVLGKGFTTTFTCVAALWHPPTVCVTQNEVDEVAPELNGLPVPATVVRAAFEYHVNVPVPVAVSIAGLPWHTVTGEGAVGAVTAGGWVIVTEDTLEQPLASVTVTLYVPGARLEIVAVVAPVLHRKV